MSGLNVKRTPTIKWGIIVGGVLRPIPSKTPLGVTQQHPNGPYCTWTCGHNPIFGKMGALCLDLWLSLVVVQRGFVLAKKIRSEGILQFPYQLIFPFEGNKGLTICSPSEIVCFLILGWRPDFPGMFIYAILRT